MSVWFVVILLGITIIQTDLYKDGNFTEKCKSVQVHFYEVVQLCILDVVSVITYTIVFTCASHFMFLNTFGHSITACDQCSDSPQKIILYHHHYYHLSTQHTPDTYKSVIYTCISTKQNLIQYLHQTSYMHGL